MNTQRDSDVTRFGVTRGGNSWCQRIFFLSKLTTFLVIAVWKVMSFFSCLTTPIFPRRLSSVLSKFSRTQN